MRWLMLIGLSLLAGCDEVPDQPKTPTPPKVTVSPADAAAPIVAEPKLDRRVGPVSIESEDEPALAANPEQPPTEPSAPAPKAKPSASVPKTKLEKVELPEPDLDLSLPEDWTENLDPAEEPTSLSLLPPLFESSESRSLQMSGELLPGAAQDEALIDGAQINFELKR
ncbi:hypothetical protein [Stutzerimonas chloritidismutans]|uniref:Translation initiation factor 2 n=1 Tax=Stutzerimonas chloritidismutans TaxID=203192 RepID=A0ABU9MB30_STUCH